MIINIDGYDLSLIFVSDFHFLQEMDDGGEKRKEFLTGRVVHKRSLSKKICFFDVLVNEEERRTVVFKIWHCGEDLMQKMLKGQDRIHVGDEIEFEGRFETDHDFEVDAYKILSKDSSFAPLPPSVKKSSSSSGGLCKFWLNSGRCPREECRFLHEVGDLGAKRKRFVDKVLERRAKIQLEHEDGEERLKSRHQRAAIFVRWLRDKFASLFDSSGCQIVLDIAGGRGDLAFELAVRVTSTLKVIVVDPREQKVKRWQAKLLKKMGEAANLPQHLNLLFDHDFFSGNHVDKEEVGLIVGMHPDEATEMLVDVALKEKIPFAVVPCCVFAHIFPDRRLKNGAEPRTFEAFCSYLKEKNENINEDYLGFRGRDKVLYWVP